MGLGAVALVVPLSNTRAEQSVPVGTLLPSPALSLAVAIIEGMSGGIDRRMAHSSGISVKSRIGILVLGVGALSALAAWHVVQGNVFSALTFFFGNVSRGQEK